MALLKSASEAPESSAACAAEESRLIKVIDLLVTACEAEESRLIELLTACARAVEQDKEDSLSSLSRMVEELRTLVSVSGYPLQRLAAYMLEGLLARIDSSGYSVCQALECSIEPAAAANHTIHFISYRNLLYESCTYLKFGCMSANGAIAQAMKGEDRIHIIDFHISDGVHWISLLQALGERPGGAPLSFRITAIDDSVPAYARGGSNLELVGRRLSHVAGVNNIPLEFHAVAVSASKLQESHLGVIPGETVAVSFNLGLHNISDHDEYDDAPSQRDRILRLVKSLSPKVVTLVEQELNTNDTTTFAQRFAETLDYYTAVFESIDKRGLRDEDTINMEQHCLGREVVNLIACDGVERVERHELFAQWKARLSKAGFTPTPLNSLMNDAIRNLHLREHLSRYMCQEREGVLYLGWRDRPLVVTSAWH